MHILLIIVIIILSILLVAVYVLTAYSQRKVSNEEIYKKLFYSNPSAVAFCLGKEGDKFRNVYIDQDNNFIEKIEDLPTNETGTPIFLKSHGDVMETSNGFTIDGIDAKFNCPSGYTGPNCIPEYPCNDESGANKPITFTSFNSLNLNQNNFSYTVDVNLLNDSPQDPINKRLYIKCLDEHNYEIHACNHNELLNTEEISKGNVICETYDICAEHINGYTHNFDPKGKPMNNNEYYSCFNGKSGEKQVCKDEFVYSLTNQTCIKLNKCVNNEGKTYPLDANNYIICNSDRERIIKCVNGVDETGVHCIESLCKPSVKTSNSDLFEYTYSVTTCIGNKENVVNCDNTEKELNIFGNLYKYPYEIYDNTTANCITVNDPKSLTTKLVDLNYNNKLGQPYSFDVKKNLYDCTGVDGLIGIQDYANKGALVNGQIVPSNTYPIEPPCITDSTPPKYNLEVYNVTYDPENIAFIVEARDNIIENTAFVTKDGDKYNFTYYINGAQYQTQTTSVPPLGFDENANTVLPSKQPWVTNAAMGYKFPYEYPPGTTIDTKVVRIEDTALNNKMNYARLTENNGKLEDADSDLVVLSWTKDTITLGGDKPKPRALIYQIKGVYIVIDSLLYKFTNGDKERKIIKE